MKKGMTEEAAIPGAGKRWALAILVLIMALALGWFAGGLGLGPVLAKRIWPERQPAAGDAPVGGDSIELGPGVIYEMENLVVNPASTQGTRFLVVSLAVELDDPVSAAELERREAEARDAVLRVLGSKTVAELADIGARDSLKVELLEVLAGVVRVGAVRRLFLPQFVIQ